MRPIDVIKKAIESDIVKNHTTMLCAIDSEDKIKDIKYVGLCALVRPYDRDDPDKYNEEEYFPVMIVNRPDGVMLNVHKTHLVMVIGAVPDNPGFSAGLLIPKNIIGSVSKFTEAANKKARVKSMIKDNTPPRGAN